MITPAARPVPIPIKSLATCFRIVIYTSFSLFFGSSNAINLKHPATTVVKRLSNIVVRIRLLGIVDLTLNPLANMANIEGRLTPVPTFARMKPKA
jgi:hypothetical protein